MAKGSFILEGSTGKVGSLVVQRRKGATILKEYVKPSNPKTQKQIAQRIIFATVQQASKFMKQIVDHSFEGIGAGEKSLQKFAQLNLQRLRSYSVVDFAEASSAADSKCFMTTKGVNTIIPNKYVVANGTLGVNTASRIKQTNSGGSIALHLFNTANTITCTATTTMGDVLEALFGLKKAGQQLTKCFIYGNNNQYLYAFNGETDAPGFAISDSGFVGYRIVVKASADLSALATTTPSASAIMALFDSEKSDAQMLQWIDEALKVTGATVDLTSGEDLEAYDLFANAYVQAYCDILSEPYGDSWKRSYAEMILVDVPQSDKNYGLYWNTAVQAWNAGGANAPSEQFLDNGGDENAVGF